MDADIADIDIYVRENKLEEVTSGRMFTKGSSAPDPTGLVSYEIFGNPGSSKRKMAFAYIDLGDTFVNPIAYDCFTLLKRVVIDICNGKGTYFVRKGEIIKVGAKKTANIQPTKDDDVGTGAKWLKRNYKKIKWSKEGMSETVKERINFIMAADVGELFCTKWLVMPAYYRDVDMNSSKKNDINIMYQALLSQSKVIKSMRQMLHGDQVTDSHIKIQAQLVEIYLHILRFIGGTKTFMQTTAIGKAVDYSGRMVISTCHSTAERPEQMDVDFSHAAVPLATVLHCFAPFIHYGFKQIITGIIGSSEYIYNIDEKGELRRLKLASDWSEILMESHIQALIKLYYDSKEHRLDPVTVKIEGGERVPIGYITDTKFISTDRTDFAPGVKPKPITLCEIFYLAAMNTVKDKEVIITRYPIQDYNNMYHAFMNIIPYNRVKRITFEDVEYDRFPDIRPEDYQSTNIGAMFEDALHLFPTYLGAMDADFDGDTTTIQGIFTSSNKPEDLIFSPVNVVNLAGGNIREFSSANYQTIYGLTRDVVNRV